MKKTLIFDFDGTIVNSRDLVIKIYNELSEKYGYRKINQTDILNSSKMSIKDRCNLLGVPMHMLPILLYEVKKIYKNYFLDLNIISGIPDVLNRIKDYGFTLGILSSNSKATIELFLKSNRNIFCSKSLFGKHFTIKNFLKNFNLKEDEVLYIGDEIRDIISCKKSNIEVVAVTWGYDAEELLLKESPDFVAYNPNEIFDIAVRGEAPAVH
jgi:Predicted phosphatases